ncbi:MAG: cell division protein FtsZ [Elusimicrobia bacterium CG_4_10_14_0_2_um_filter_56_8]|nr:MAG: cell division protein FtsZ [Elusimicrobia bacterium CG_4_10_14_0_2_um_filter_56_8]
MSENRIRYSNDFHDREAVIKVIGVGGGGGNAVNRMVEADIRLVEFIAVNTDAQDLRRSKAPNRMQIGEALTKGLGVGGDPARGKEAALESFELLREAVSDADLLFITAGMGGGTGTGAAPVVAQAAKESNPNALVIGVVTRPFGFEAKARADQAQAGIQELRKHTDCLLVIPNDRILSVVDRETSSSEAYRKADDVLRQAIQGISDVITCGGSINVDFADVRKIMTKSGEALIGIGRAAGPDRHTEAAKQAVHSPMLESAVIDGAKGILVNFASSRDMRMVELDEAMEYIKKHANPDVFVKFGQAFDETLGDEIKITVIATGFPSRRGELAGDMARLRGMGRASHRRADDDFFPAPAGTSALSDEDIEKPAYLRRQSGTRRLK